ncbi:hypothetical protein [Tsuneonella troitsensis]|uniref:hypothetical protein n=1 Tax=Tsuneonella troitsensis TaxID=292222 RepID=UPI00070A9415|nr:hypothetical protein [Tsuneonella troitsensis]
MGQKKVSYEGLDKLGRERLSPSFFMRDFLYSEIANFYGVPNIPDDPKLAVEAGRRLCEELLEPLQERFGRISIRSAYRSSAVNALGNEKGHNCASNEGNYAAHIWDRKDANDCIGATACVVVNSFVPYYERTGHWEALAWWVHDHLPYATMTFFPKLAAFNLRWHENPARHIKSEIPPRKGTLTKPGMANFEGTHEKEYAEWLSQLG